MDFYREDKEILAEAMKVIEEDTFRLADRIMGETGIDGLFVSLQNAGVDKFTGEEYTEYLRPWDMRLLTHVNSLSEYNIVHMCSWTGIPNRLELWRDYDYQTVNWAVNVEKNLDMRRARSYFRPGTTLMGGFDNRPQGVLYKGSEEEIKAYTKGSLIWRERWEPFFAGIVPFKWTRAGKRCGTLLRPAESMRRSTGNKRVLGQYEGKI